MTTQTTPAKTPSASHVWKSVLTMLHTSIPEMITSSSRIAHTGECVRSFTSESFSGSSRSNDQANQVRIGMKVLPTMAGRLQKRNEPTMRKVKIGALKTSEERKWYQGPVGSTEPEAAVLTAAMKS